MKKTVCLLAFGMMLSSFNSNADDDYKDHHKKHIKTFHVKITNATQHQIISPPAVIAHSNEFMLFKVGDSPTEELAMLAEGGNNQPLLEMAKHAPHVFAVEGGEGGIPPGETLTVEIKAPWNSYFTVAGMLVSTNDGFMSVTTRSLWNSAMPTYAMAFDAGSEMNDESCDYVPGPPCGGMGFSDDTGEGFISIHPGIRGDNGVPVAYDWRGPVAVVSVHRAH